MNRADLPRLRCQNNAGFTRLNFGSFLIETCQAAIKLEQIDGQLLLKMGQVGLS